MFQLPYTDGEPRESVSTQCKTCHEITEQEYIKIAPVNDEPVSDPIEFMKLMKRLVICMKCGTLRLIN